jgi:hypothetical protein
MFIFTSYLKGAFELICSSILTLYTTTLITLYDVRYLVPKEISQHTSHIFNTVQLPASIVNHKTVQNTKNKIKNTSKHNNKNKNKDVIRVRRTTSMTYHDTDISLLRALYNIPDIQGSTNLTQSLFETNEEHYSPNDLETFQNHYSVTVQPAIPIGGYTTETCSLHSGQGNTCFEANLDIQYMMGISQLTTTKGTYVVYLHKIVLHETIFGLKTFSPYIFHYVSKKIVTYHKTKIMHSYL